MLLRFVVSGCSSLSSQLYLEALGCSRRVLGLILRLYLRCIRSPPRTQRSSSLFLDGRGARSFNADERRLLQQKGRMLIPGRESAHGSKAPARENVGLVALKRRTCVVRQIAGHMGSHVKARGDLHGRRHAHPLRRSDNDLTLAFPPGRCARHTDHQHQKWTDRSAEADAADRAWILPATEIPLFAV